MVQLVVAIQFLLPSSDEALPLIFVIACGLATAGSPAVECHLQTTERKVDSTMYHWYFAKASMHTKPSRR